MRRALKPMTPQQAKVKLEDLCARAEHSTGELRERLYKWGITSSEADLIITSLKKNRFVDDMRFANALVRDKVKFARWGRRKISQALYLKHVDPDIIRQVLDEIDEGIYLDNIRHLISIKTKSTPDLIESYEGRTKLYRFLISRGYEPDVAARILKEALSAKD